MNLSDATQAEAQKKSVAEVLKDNACFEACSAGILTGVSSVFVRGGSTVTEVVK